LPDRKRQITEIRTVSPLAKAFNEGVEKIVVFGTMGPRGRKSPSGVRSRDPGGDFAWKRKRSKSHIGLVLKLETV